MPYNTTAIPPRKEATGHNQLPLTRVKKIIDQDSEIAKCSNNAAFIITCAAEMFIQHLADAAHTQARTERKPRRNIQYKDVASAVSHQDSLEFLEDVVPRTVPLKRVKASAKATQARLGGDKSAEDRLASSHAVPPMANGTGGKARIVNGEGPAFSVPLRVDDRVDDPGSQLALEMRQAAAAASSHDGDVQMSG